MTEEERKDLQDIIRKMLVLNDEERASVKIALEALLAKQELEEVANGKRYE